MEYMLAKIHTYIPVHFHGKHFLLDSEIIRLVFILNIMVIDLHSDH